MICVDQFAPLAPFPLFDPFVSFHPVPPAPPDVVTVPAVYV